MHTSRKNIRNSINVSSSLSNKTCRDFGDKGGGGGVGARGSGSYTTGVLDSSDILYSNDSLTINGRKKFSLSFSVGISTSNIS